MTVAAAQLLDALMAQHGDGKPLVIHTGNWGAGAFGNSKQTVWAMRRAAMEAAYLLFSQATGQAPRLDFFYDAFDPAGVRAANEAFNVFASAFRDLDPGQVCPARSSSGWRRCRSSSARRRGSCRAARCIIRPRVAGALRAPPVAAAGGAGNDLLAASSCATARFANPVAA